RKGKEIVVEVPAVVEEEEKQQQQQQRKGKEVALEVPLPAVAESYDDSDLDSGSGWETCMAGYAAREEYSEKKEQERKEKKPAWLDTLLRTKFWDPCKEHGSKNRADQCMFCLRCSKLSCPRCVHDQPGHRLLKIRRYVYRSVVHASDMQELGIDVSRIQTYVINARKVLHLRPMNRSKHFRPQAGTPRCITCRTWLRSAPNLFCSLTCEEDVDVSQDDFSGPEAELRYRSFQVHMAEPAEELLPDDPEVEHEIMPAQVEPPPPAAAAAANQNVSLRRRARKQAAPLRAPFF
ncbi:hypothetical protein Zm00014a_016438, partial [Zea mays]